MPGLQTAPRWLAGAWFGCQFGCTAWLLTGAAEVLSAAPAVAAVWAGTFVAANGVGVWLWRRRAASTAAMLLVCGTAGLAAVGVLRLARPGEPVSAVAYLLPGVGAAVGAVLGVSGATGSRSHKPA